ncbi:unnamed protein product [Calicophoron daubneyi]|uniref:Uncharacterized protein n=1 Tax=Calicophoron daubneyi TaxID=300641 RepID=A0AAV2TUB4_CALDB
MWLFVCVLALFALVGTEHMQAESAYVRDFRPPRNPRIPPIYGEDIETIIMDEEPMVGGKHPPRTRPYRSISNSPFPWVDW